MSDLTRHIGDIARRLLGEPNNAQSTRSQLRFGANGSVAVEIAGPKVGTWFDHEEQIGGGVRELLRIKGELADDDIADWLKRNLGIEQETNGQDRSSTRYVVATYYYHDEKGAVLFRVRRWGPKKTFTQNPPDGKGGWKTGTGCMDGVRLAPYHLPELVAAKATANGTPWRVYILEGEKDVDNVVTLWGLTATTNPMGAGKWHKEFNRFFVGADIVILADNDEAGQKHSRDVASQLAPVAASVRIVKLQGLPDKGDISDWIEAGGSQSDFETTVEDTAPFVAVQAEEFDDVLQDLENRAPPSGEGGIQDEPGSDPWNHPLDPWHHLDLPSLQGLELPSRRWIVPGWVPVLETTGLAGAGGMGKTLLAQMLATAAALGVPWLEINLRRIKTLLLLCEDRDDDFRIRQANINQHYGCDFADLGNMRPVPRRNNPRNRLMIFDRDGIGHPTTFFSQLLQEAKKFAGNDPLLTIIDTRADVFLGNQNDEDQARTFVRQCTDRIAIETNGASLLLYQPSRAGMRDGTGESGSVQWDAAFRSRLYQDLPKPEGDKEPDHPYARVLTRQKPNFALRGETINMKWEDGVFIRTETPSGVTLAATYQRANRIFLGLLDKNIKAGRRLSDSKNAGNYAPKVFATSPERDGLKLKQFEVAMKYLFDVGKIRMKDDRHGRLMALAEVANGTGWNT